MVQRGEISQQLVVTGDILAAARVDVFPKVAGHLRELQVEEGDRVHAEQELARIADDDLAIQDTAPEGGQGALTAVAGNVVAMLPLAGMVDLDAERDRLRKEIASAEAERDRARAQLGNEAFVSRAPEKVVEVQRRRLVTAEEQIALLGRRLVELDG